MTTTLSLLTSLPLDPLGASQDREVTALSWVPEEGGREGCYKGVDRASKGQDLSGPVNIEDDL